MTILLAGQIDPKGLRPVADAGHRAPVRDLEIENLRALIASRPGITLSFDCFDTILWRGVPKPTDVFSLVGQRLKDLGLLRAKTTPELFAKMRVLAEQVARAQAKITRQSTETTLAEIYAFNGWRRYTSLSGPELMRHELIVESNVTTADPWLRELLEDLSRSANPPRIVLVSDTYLDTSSLRFLLTASGLECLADVAIFASSEHGVSKSDGLLGKALTALGIEPSDCIHIGNSFESDVKPATKLGITPVHLPEASPLVLRAIASEGWLSGRAEPSELLDRRSGDSGLTAVRGRIGRHRPSSLPASDALMWDVGATTLGPIFTGFAEWVHERTGELGIETALCLMREGELLAQLLKAVPAAQRTCTPVPFWASREACLRATFFSGSVDELNRVLWRADSPSPEAILATLGLGVRDIPRGREVIAAARQIVGPAEAASAFIQHLASDDVIREQIIQRSTARRKAFVKYLLASLKGAGRTVALVDLGFGATIQESIHSMATAEGLDLDFRGLYVYTCPRALIRQLNGHIAEGFLADTGTPHAKLVTVDRSPEIIEVSTTSSDGTLLEIADDGHAVLAQRGPLTEQDRQRVILQDGMRAFQREWNFFADNNTLSSHKRLGQSPDALLRVLNRFVGRPGAQIAEAFAGWSHEANFGSDRQDLLVPDVIRRSVGYLAPEHLVMSKATDLYWVGAAAARFGFEEEVNWLQEDQAPLGKFIQSSSAGNLILGAVPCAGEKQGDVGLPIVFHTTGNGRIAWSGHTRSREFVLRTSGPHAVVRLDRLAVTRDNGRTETFDWRGPTRAAPSGVKVTADAVTGEGVAVLSDASVMRISLPGKGSGAITEVEILYGALLT